MTDPSAPAPIAVNSSAKPDMTMTAVRDLLKIAGAALVSHGVIQASTVEPLVGALLVIAPVVWSQLVTIAKSRRAAAMAAQLPDSIATLK